MLFQPSIFRGYVSFREGPPWKLTWTPKIPAWLKGKSFSKDESLFLVLEVQQMEIGILTFKECQSRIIKEWMEFALKYKLQLLHYTTFWGSTGASSALLRFRKNLCLWQASSRPVELERLDRCAGGDLWETCFPGIFLEKDGIWKRRSLPFSQIKLDSSQKCCKSWKIWEFLQPQSWTYEKLLKNDRTGSRSFSSFWGRL